LDHTSITITTEDLLVDKRSEIAWLARRAGWGLAPGELDELSVLGTDAVLDRLTRPDAVGVAPNESPWNGMQFLADPQGKQRATERLDVLTRWMSHMGKSPRPFEDAMAWFWHDHFAVSSAVVNYLPSMVAHLELLQQQALGNFREMIRAITVDAAMLVFLDGATSTGKSPNENYGRELQELYTLGIGNYTEADVRAAAVALTGYVVRRRAGWKVNFVPQRHDDRPQVLLGVDGVHDVDTVVDTILDHPAVPTRIAGKMAAHYLGETDASLVNDLAAVFADSSLEIAPLGRAMLEAGLSGRSKPIVLAPVPWLIQISRATSAAITPRAMVSILRNMGQMPGQPPNVGGYPGSAAWLSSSSTAARFSAAGLIAAETPEEAPALAAAASGNWSDLADLLLRPDGFSDATRTALNDLPASTGRRPGEGRLAVALSSPDLLIA